MKRLWAVLATSAGIFGSGFMTGCAHEPARLASGVQTVEVRVPVAVPCVDPKALPQRPPTSLPEPDADVARKAAGASAEVRALEQYAKELRAALIACSAMP